MNNSNKQAYIINVALINFILNESSNLGQCANSAESGSLSIHNNDIGDHTLTASPLSCHHTSVWSMVDHGTTKGLAWAGKPAVGRARCSSLKQTQQETDGCFDIITKAYVTHATK